MFSQATLRTVKKEFSAKVQKLFLLRLSSVIAGNTRM